MKTPPAIKRLFADIETAPNVVLAFQAGYNLTINHDAIVSERKVICIAYKWEGERKVTVLRWDKDQDDKAMLRQFCAVAEQADEIVGHYGNHFDWPWIRTRVLYHHLPPVPIWKTVDTKAIAAKYFYFNSNKLDYISNFLGHGRKLRTDFSLWKRVLLDKCPRALNYMCKYCGVDVKRLESVFKDFQPFIRPHSHAGVAMHREKWTCPHCGSEKVSINKTYISASGAVSYGMKCGKCGAYYRVGEKARQLYLKAKK